MSELESLYPFLHGQAKNAKSEHAALLESVAQKAAHSVEVKQRFFAHHAEDLIAVAHTLANCFANGGRLFTMGNGGSHADASHVAVEFQHPVTAGRPSLPAFDLAADTTLLTALGNDLGFRNTYVRPLIAHARRGDALIGLSTSGNSENLMAAFEKARELGLSTIGFAGMDGGEMRSSGLLDHCLVVPTDSIHRIQEVHVACYHILWDLTHTLLADTRGGLGSSD